MNANAHYLSGYVKACMFMQKLAFENADKKQDPEFLKHLSSGASWSPSASGYLKNTYNSPFNLHKGDPNTRYHVADSSITGDAYRNQELAWQKREAQAKADIDKTDASWTSWIPLNMWWKRRRLSNIQEDHSNWMKGRADEAAKRMADDEGTDFAQLLQRREQNPSLSTGPAFRAPNDGDWATRTNIFRDRLSGVQDDISAQLQAHDYTGTFLDPRLDPQQQRRMAIEAGALNRNDYKYYSPILGGRRLTNTVTDVAYRSLGKAYRDEYMRGNNTNTAPTSDELWGWMRSRDSR